MDESEDVLEDLEATLLPTETEEIDLDSTGDLDQSSERRGPTNGQSHWDTAQTVTLELRNKMPRYLYVLACSYFPTLWFWCLVSPLFRCKSCGLLGNCDNEIACKERPVECYADNYLGVLFVWSPCMMYFSVPKKYADGWHWHWFLVGMLITKANAALERAQTRWMKAKMCSKIWKRLCFQPRQRRLTSIAPVILISPLSVEALQMDNRTGIPHKQ